MTEVGLAVVGSGMLDGAASHVSAAPIGVFDSGVGGLSIVREITARMPTELLVYLADSAHAPYGDKSPETIVNRSNAACGWLIAQGVKALVVACNTATAHAIAELRSRYPDVPVIGVEPGLKPAALLSKSKVVGVLATEQTLASQKFRRLLDQHEPTCRYICQAGIGLVPLIEAGETDSAAVYRLLERYLSPMLAAGADTLVLGCTHYPFLIPAIRAISGDRLQLIDTGEAIARQLERKLVERDTRHTPRPVALRGSQRFCVTAASAPLQRMVSAFFGDALGVTVETIALSG